MSYRKAVSGLHLEHNVCPYNALYGLHEPGHISGSLHKCLRHGYCMRFRDNPQTVDFATGSDGLLRELIHWLGG